MAEQKPAEIVEPVAVAAEAPAVTATTAPVAEEKAPEPAADTGVVAETAAVPATAPTAPASEEVKKEAPKPVEEGHIEHKGQGANFPKNLIFSKKFIWFGSEPVDLKSIPTFKADKVADVAHHYAAWASETGKGLLFYSDKDKTAPQGVINLADASEPTNEGNSKFHFTAKGQKHSFKAGSTSERDSWVSHLKVKIAEAKQLAATVTESETYKKTLESLKPKKETPESVKPKKETPAAVEPAVAVAADPAVVAAPAEESAAPADTVATPAVAETAKDEAKKTVERRSASRKRASVFGTIFGGGKKEEEKKTVEPAKTEEVKAVEPEVPTTEAVPAPAETVETAPEATAETPANNAASEKKDEAPKPAKRQSIFANLSFTKKKSAGPDTPKETPVVTEPVAETAPVIPAVEPTEPLSAEVASPANVPVETSELTPPPAMKSDKRKSSLPFAFGKKEKAASDEEGEKSKSPGPFSKLRATIKGGKKADEKKDEVPAVPTEIGAVEASTEAAAVKPDGAASAEAEAVKNEVPAADGELSTETAAVTKEDIKAEEPAVTEPKVESATPVTAAA